MLIPKPFEEHPGIQFHQSAHPQITALALGQGGTVLVRVGKVTRAAPDGATESSVHTIAFDGRAA